MIWSHLRTVACVLAVAASGCASHGTSTSLDRTARPSAPARDVEIPLRPYFRDLRSTEVRVGDGALTFLVDSGGGRTVLSPELARRLDCVPHGRDVGYRMSGEAVAFALCPSFSASVAGFPIVLQPVAVFDVNRLLPPELPRVDGVLALDAFRGQVLTLDWAADRVVVHSAHAARAALESSGVPVRFATGEDGAALTVLAPVHGTDRTLWFLIDSGNISGTLVGRHVSDEASLPRAIDGTASIVIGAQPPVSLAVHVEDVNYDGVLGTDFLRRRPVTLDLRP